MGNQQNSIASNRLIDIAQKTVWRQEFTLRTLFSAKCPQEQQGPSGKSRQITVLVSAWSRLLDAKNTNILSAGRTWSTYGGHPRQRGRPGIEAQGTSRNFFSSAKIARFLANLRRLEEALGRRYPPVTGSWPIAPKIPRYVAST